MHRMDERGAPPSFTVGDRVRIRLRPDCPQPHAVILDGCIGTIFTTGGSRFELHRYAVYVLGNNGLQRGRYTANELEPADEFAP